MVSAAFGPANWGGRSCHSGGCEPIICWLLREKTREEMTRCRCSPFGWERVKSESWVHSFDEFVHPAILRRLPGFRPQCQSAAVPTGRSANSTAPTSTAPIPKIGSARSCDLRPRFLKPSMRVSVRFQRLGCFAASAVQRERLAERVRPGDRARRKFSPVRATPLRLKRMLRDADGELVRRDIGARTISAGEFCFS